MSRARSYWPRLLGCLIAVGLTGATATATNYPILDRGTASPTAGPATTGAPVGEVCPCPQPYATDALFGTPCTPACDVGCEVYRPFGGMFSKGSWVVGVGGYSTVWSEDGRLAGPRLSVGKYWWDNIGLYAESSTMIGEETRFGEGSTWGQTFDGIVRWHHRTTDWYSLYTDIGVGLSLLSRSLPSGGTNFNFTLHGGGGAIWKLNDWMNLQFGVRWFHMSNGNFFHHQNPGFDSLTVYGGVLCPF